ncbi:MAG: sulfatase-like hydrolase/transferase, partial [Candidatus Hydrogenedentes bacterium]|nr:sulfatase-like hydrolase/transferase [Candidatus Hydrogenedentota bacterium]
MSQTGEYHALSRRGFLKAAGAGTLAWALHDGETAWGAEPARPNIVVILADDLGYADLGCQGCSDIPTPNIDSLAREGVRFTNGYVSCPVCSPTRAGLMTGRYQQRFGHEFNPGPPTAAQDTFGLPLDQPTIAERLKAAGYATGLFGKWHLGFKPEMQPQKRGFDEFYGFLGGAHNYLRVGEKANPIMRGTEPVADIDYTTDAFAREAVSFIDRHRTVPFFLYVPFNAVHAPLEAPEKYLSRFPNIEDKKRRTFAAMLSALDDNVGLILAKLRECQLEENTLVFFISDNGGPTVQTSSRNHPLQGFKGQVYEGGIRVPFLAQWKGRIPSGKVDDRPVIAIDVHPTALAVAGVIPPADAKLEGVNLLPYLTGQESAAPHDALFWR